MVRSTISSIWNYINPVDHLGEKKYPAFFPIAVIVPTTVILELLFEYIFTDPNILGQIAITLYLVFIIYFSFRTGISGGFTAVFLTVAYYLYIIYDRRYSGQALISGIQTTLVLGLIYGLLALIIGWLRQKIDTLIDDEVVGKKRLETIIRQLPVGILITDNQGYIVEVNDQAKNIVGQHLQPSVKMNSTLFELYKTKNKEPVADDQFPITLAINQGKITRNQEFMIRRKDGKTVELIVSSAPIINRANRIVAGVSIYQDISNIKEIERRKDDFVNIASHELKTPITSLVLYLSILKKRLAQQDLLQAKSTITNIEKQINNLNDIINNLLEVSRHQVGKTVYVKEKFRLDELIGEAVTALAGESISQPIVIDETKRVTIKADRLKIYQVITNLITNAIKYSARSGVIKIKLEAIDGYAQVSVQDQGIGIPKSQRKKIFKRLYQVDSKASSTFPGFGMGLYIAQQIIKYHKGKIWVDSIEGQGSTFYFTLPLQKGQK